MFWHEKASGVSNAPRGNEAFVPVGVGKRFDAYTSARFGAVDESVLPDVDAGMISGPRDLEDDDVPGAHLRALDLDAGLGLTLAHTRHGNAIFSAGPVDQPGTVEARRGGTAAIGIGAAKLTLGCSGDARAPDLRRILVARHVAFAAGRQQGESGAEHERYAES